MRYPSTERRQVFCRQRFCSTSLILTLIASSAFIFVQSACQAQQTPAVDAPVSHTKLEAVQVSDFDSLKSFARAQVDQPWQPAGPLPQAWADLNYEQFCEIQFDPQKATWSDHSGLLKASERSPFWLESFHRGFVQRTKVALFTIDDGTVEPLPFSPADFEYGSLAEKLQPTPELGHAGFRIAGYFPDQADPQELLSFLGGCYFRGRSNDTFYGASARGLALNIGMNQPEEFPAFSTCWVKKPAIGKPAIGDKSLVVLAHLNGPSVSGAYEFTFAPGMTESVVSIRCVVYFRQDVGKVGVAPLTSMWMWGDGLKGPAKDGRPGVHDSDGLLIETQTIGSAEGVPSESSEWTWRPFARQAYPSVSFRKVDRLLGFGVLQRNRAFFHYDDHNARYDKRPSVWVKTAEPWENGRVEVLELPGAHEGIDNVGVYWVPDVLPTVDKPLELAYDVSFFAGDRPNEAPLARATNFDLKRSAAPKEVEIEIRFSGDTLSEVEADEDIDIDATIRGAEIVEKGIQGTDTGDRLVTVKFRITGEGPPELNLQLKREDQVLSERFLYLCPPEQPEFVYPQVYSRQE